MPGMKHESAHHPRFVDLSHHLASDMPVAPGLPRPRFEPFLTHAASRPIYGHRAEFEITRLFLVGNSGTAIDSPYHRHAQLAPVDQLPLERLAGVDGLCLDAPGGGPLKVDLPARLADRAVLLRTGWDRRWSADDYWSGGPYLDDALAARLEAARIGLLGVDFANVDDQRDLARPVHTRLLRAGILIVENLRGLDRLPIDGFRLFALPPAIEGAAAVPVRVVAELTHPDVGRI
jgi:arylformamidase